MLLNAFDAYIQLQTMGSVKSVLITGFQGQKSAYCCEALS